MTIWRVVLPSLRAAGARRHATSTTKGLKRRKGTPMDSSNLVEQVAEDFRTAIETGAVDINDPQGGLQLVVDLVRASNPDVMPPPKLCGFSLLCGSAFILGARLAREDIERNY